jgi:hypothetical protein
MKTKTIKNIRTAVVLLASMGGISLAQAVAVNGALGGSVNSEDSWRLKCPAGTVEVRANVHDLAVDGVTLGVLVTRAFGAPEKLKADFRAPVQDGANSLFANLTGGPDDYHVLVIKTAGGGAIAYSSVMECRDVNGNVINNAAPVLTQEQ